MSAWPREKHPRQKPLTRILRTSSTTAPGRLQFFAVDPQFVAAMVTARRGTSTWCVTRRAGCASAGRRPSGMKSGKQKIASERRWYASSNCVVLHFLYIAETFAEPYRFLQCVCGNSCKRDNHTVLMVLLYPCNKIVYIGSFSPILKKKKAY